MSLTICVELPSPLCRLACLPATVKIAVDGTVTLDALIDALEHAHPALTGTLRDPANGKRRPFIRFFVAEEDLSDLPLDAPLPEALADGTVSLWVVGAIAGG